MPTGFRGPVRYRKDGDRLDYAPFSAVSALSQVQGIQGYGDDFLFYSGPNVAGAAGGWILTETAAGAGNTSRVDVDDNAPGGFLRLNTDNAASDGEFLQTQGEPWKYVLGKRLWFNIRLSVDVVGHAALLFGLAITDTSPIASLPADGIFFEKAATATKMDFHARKSGTSTERTLIDSAVMANATMREYGFVVSENGTIVPYIDGVGINASAIPGGNANIPNTLGLALHMAISTDETTAHFMLVDHVMVAQER